MEHKSINNGSEYGIVSIKDEFLRHSTPGIGRIMNEPFKRGTRLHDIEVAKWIIDKFGGELEYLETGSVKKPDYLWNDKEWEVKKVSGTTSIQNQLRKAHRQSKDGLVIVDVTTSALGEKKFIESLSHYMWRYKLDTIIVKRNNTLVDILKRN
jgi:hypothetical protein